MRPALPPLGLHGWLVGVLYEVGPTMPAGAGMGPISQQELASYQVNTATRLTPWEARTVRAMSVAFLAESHEAEKPEREPPWKGCGITASDIKKVMAAEAMRAASREYDD